MGENKIKKTRTLFGTDGIRGKAGSYPITPDFAMKIGKAIGVYFKKHSPNPRILIGKDTRISGYMLEQAITSGICSVGVDVLQLGPLPTPGIAYLTRGMRACAGIVISASHNPYHDNGIKIFDYQGKKLGDDVEVEIESLILENDLEQYHVQGKAIGRAKRVDDAVGQYAVFLKEQFPREYTLEGFRIVLDCANGAGYKVAPKVFSELGAEILCEGIEPNGFNINDECGALYPKNLGEKVKLYKADIGIALDGDADRLMVCDDKGVLFDGDDYLAVVARYLIEKKRLKKNTVVSTVMSNLGLTQSLAEVGGKVLHTKVGDRYVTEAMRAGEFVLGGEPSGHIIFSEISTAGDGILSALMLLSVMCDKKQPVSKLREVIQKMPQVTSSVNVKRKVPLSDMPAFQGEIRKVEQELGDNGRVLFRYSGTENKARIMVEGPSRAKIEGHADFLSKAVLDAIQKSCQN